MPEVPKLSFAKVAATGSPRHVPKDRLPQTATISSDTQAMGASNRMMEPTAIDKGFEPAPRQDISSENNMGTADVNNAAEELDNLHLQPQLPNDASSLQHQRPAVVSRESGASDDSQRADSSSELGTKPPSLDGKSITSGTTFALDEKESLRPDDSASVQAAAEDDDTFSIRGSHFAGSRVGSDLAARARGIQLGDMPDRRLMQTASASSGQGLLTPQSTPSEQQLGAGPDIPALAMGQDPDALNLTYRHAPDDKLIEAMGTMKDRVYLLRLEKELINFVENSKEPFMDLEQSNSFLRMLAHKLADYYHMTHSFEPNLQKVRIFRTPFCRVPTSLAQFDPAPNPSASSTPPPVILPKKIMRRGQDGDGGPLSTNPSKPTSEAGSDSKDKDKSANNQKLTREEREEAYKLAREKIFGSAEDAGNDADKDTVPSRASSVSGNNKTSNGKGRRTGRHRRDDSDGFDSRNHYAPCWGPQQQAWIPHQYGHPPNVQAMPPQAPVYNTQMPPAPVYGQQNMPPYQGMPGMAANAGYPMYAPPPQFTPQPSQQRYHPSGSPMAPYGQSAPGTPQQQTWQTTPYSPGYQGSSGPPAAPGMRSAQPGIPYAFGQLPANVNPNDPKSQHPIPGSYNRNSAFNPMTQSFVPGSSNMPQVHGSQPPFTAPSSHNGSPHVGSPHPNFQSYQQGPSQPYAGGYGMVRQASNTSLPGYHPSQSIPSYPQHPPTQHNPHQPPLQHINPNQAQTMPNRPPIPNQGSNHVFTHLPTYGNPATLPQKPATGI